MSSAFSNHLRRVRRATTGGRAASIAALIVCIIVILVAAPQAQQAPAFSPTASGGTRLAAADAPTDIDLLVGRSTVLNVGSTIARVSLTVPDIADALVTAPSQLLIHGKQPGTISLFVWDRGGAIKTYEVKVRRDLTPLVAHVKQLFPGEPITVMGSGRDVVLSGTVSGQYVINKAAEVAGGYVEKKENVVNLLRQQEGIASNQVLLRVRFAEVSRNALQELGVSMFSDGNNDLIGRTTTQQYAAPFFDQRSPYQGKNLQFSDYLNLYLFDTKNQLGAVVKSMQQKGVFQSLAEPNLVAINGKEASFLAGGEFPYPVPTGINQVTIHFKEFGVRLKFTPTVLGGDLINLKLNPEVSTLDFNNAVVLEGFRVPALTTRRADTEIELRDGQTFAIAGLMNNTALSSMRKVPGLGDIPVLGYLFRSRAYQKDQTELVVMVTPTILRRDSTGASEGLPSLIEPYLGAPPRTHPNPDPYVGSPRYPSNQPAPRTGGTEPAPMPQPEPQASTAPAWQPSPVAVQPAPLPGQAPVQVARPAAPLASRPIQNADPQVTAGPASQQAMPAPQPVERVSEADRRAAEAQQKRDAQRRLAEARAAETRRLEEERRRAEQADVDARLRAEQQRKDEESRRLAERLDKERAKREAEVAKRNAEIARKKAEEDAKREKTLTEAADRLKQAQAAYQAELEKAKGSSNDKAKSTKASPPSTPRR